MDLTFNINLNFSILGVVIFGLIVWGGYRGFKIGGIVSGMSLFALFGTFVICAILTKVVYDYFWKLQSNVPHIFGSLTLGITFGLAIWFSHFIQKAVKKRTSEDGNDLTNKIIGSALNVVKFLVIVGVYSTVILNLNENGNFLPAREKESHFVNASAWTVTKIMKAIKMDKHKMGPTDYNPTNFPLNKGIDFSDNKKNNTNTNTNNNTNTDNKSNVIKDVKDNNF